MDNLKKLNGVHAPLVTPFINGEISYKKFEENIEKYNDTELAGYAPSGTNAGYLSLTEVEEGAKNTGPYKEVLDFYELTGERIASNIEKLYFK